MAKKTFVGKVVSVKMKDTVVVLIERSVRHPIYKKILKKTRKIKADTNGHDIKLGEIVKIEQAKPLSRDKHFKVVGVVKE